MNQITNITGAYPRLPIQQRAVDPAESRSRNGTAVPNDEVEISDVGAALARIEEVPSLRVDRIAALKAEIEAGTFETQERIDGTVDRLLEEL